MFRSRRAGFRIYENGDCSDAKDGLVQPVRIRANAGVALQPRACSRLASLPWSSWKRHFRGRTDTAAGRAPSGMGGVRGRWVFFSSHPGRSFVHRGTSCGVGRGAARSQQGRESHLPAHWRAYEVSIAVGYRDWQVTLVFEPHLMHITHDGYPHSGRLLPGIRKEISSRVNLSAATGESPVQ